MCAKMKTFRECGLFRLTYVVESASEVANLNLKQTFQDWYVVLYLSPPVFSLVFNFIDNSAVI